MMRNFFITQTVLYIKSKKKIFGSVSLFTRLIQTLPNQNGVCVPSYFSSSDIKTAQIIQKHFKLYENFISLSEEEDLLKEIEPILKRRRYEKDHWDDAIKGYKETEKLDWNEFNSKVLTRIQSMAFTEKSSLIRPIHVLDLSKDGFIKPHIDSVRFCGDTIAGLSLLSASVMRLAMENQKNIFVDVLLSRRSLYIMKGVARYKFTHEILEDSVSYFKGKRIVREHRVSVICRNEPVENISE